MPQNPDSVTRIAIIGAGPAGLAAAYYLKALGYTQVTVFERLGRVGGLCRSITDGYRSFDLGGNYVTPAYRETLRIARSVGACTMKAHEYIAARVEGGEFRYYDLYDLVRQDPQDPERRIGLFVFARAIVRFGWLRFKLRSKLDGPTLATVDEDKDLCISFEEWLGRNDLLALRGLFEIPITMMGYGFLDEIAAPYALKYMSLRTYLAMVQRGIPGLKRLSRWPRRFKDGFQRMWDRVSWGLNVRLGVEILEIRRGVDSERPIRIRFQHEEQIGNEQIPNEGELWFDRLIIACPLTLDVLGKFLDLSSRESDLFGKIQPYSFCQTSLHCVDDEGRPFKLRQPVVCVFPFSRETIGKPWALVQYWGDQSPMLQVYSRRSREDGGEVHRDETIRAVVELLRRLGAEPAGARDPRDARWLFYTCWPYFGHVDSEEIRNGFFRALEDLQGEEHTYYVGGATHFELIEPIVQYAKHLVETHFARA